VGLEGNTEKTKYVFMSFHQIAEQIYNIRIGTKSSRTMAKLKNGINSKKSEFQRRRI
jgi:hypothetical protein